MKTINSVTTLHALSTFFTNVKIRAGVKQNTNDGLALNYRAAKTDYSKLHVELLF